MATGPMRKLYHSNLTPSNEFEEILFSLLLKQRLEFDEKKKYGDYFIKNSSDEFIEVIPYDILTKFIYTYNIFDTTVLDTMFNEIQKYIKEDEITEKIKKEKSIKCLNKIIRHIHLALVQYDFISERTFEISKLNWELQQARDSLDILTSDLDKKVNEVEKNIYSNQMSVLGIFAGVVVAFIGGFGVTVNVFSNLVNNVPINKIIVISSLLFIGISSTIYLLLMVSSGITSREKLALRADKVFYKTVRILALICLGSALVYQLQFSKENPILITQGLWYEKTFKYVEIFVTVIMIFFVTIPKPLFKLKNIINNKM